MIGGKYFITLLLLIFTFSEVYNNLFICIKFGDEYSGYSFKGAWTEANSGGTPLKNTPESNKLWADNPQYLIELKQSAHVFISLG